MIVTDPDPRTLLHPGIFWFFEARGLNNRPILGRRHILKRPVVDQETCIGCGACVEVCPTVFELREDEKAWVIGPDKCDTCNCQEAIDICPTQAISWSED